MPLLNYHTVFLRVKTINGLFIGEYANLSHYGISNQITFMLMHTCTIRGMKINEAYKKCKTVKCQGVTLESKVCIKNCTPFGLLQKFSNSYQLSLIKTFMKTYCLLSQIKNYEVNCFFNAILPPYYPVSNYRAISILRGWVKEWKMYQGINSCTWRGRN